jgi:hypothetical protein
MMRMRMATAPESAEQAIKCIDGLGFLASGRRIGGAGVSSQRGEE